ncbi:outer membrane porin, OprD family [compost metagenome]
MGGTNTYLELASFSCLQCISQRQKGLPTGQLRSQPDSPSFRATPNGKEWGSEIELSYKVQSGSWKNLNVRLRNASIRRDYNSNEFDDNRVIVNYPFSLF